MCHELKPMVNRRQTPGCIDDKLQVQAISAETKPLFIHAYFPWGCLKPWRAPKIVFT
jgi:hypothetical protein